MNPFFGFGVTVAATQAVAFDGFLKKSLVVDRRAQDLMRKVAKPAWNNAAEQDSRLHGHYVGKRVSLKSRVFKHLGQKLVAGRSQSPLLAKTFLTLFNLNATPRVLLRPDVLVSLMRVR